MSSADLSTSAGFAQTLLDAVNAGQWRVAAALGVVLLVFGVRRVAPLIHGAFGALVNSDRGSAVLSLIVGVAGSVGTSLVAGKPLSLALVLSGVVMSATASGMFNLGKKIAKPSDKDDLSEVPTLVLLDSSLRALLLLLLVPLLGACAHNPPSPTPAPSQQYEAALVQCLQDEGVADAPGVGAQVWQILMTPGWTQPQIVAKLEAIGVTLGGTGAQIVVSCSVLAWFELHPIAADQQPTPAQAAARVYQARYRHALRHHDTGVVKPHASLLSPARRRFLECAMLVDPARIADCVVVL